MMSKKASTMSLDSRLFRPRRSNSSSASSAFVRVGVSSVGSITGFGGLGRSPPGGVLGSSAAGVSEASFSTVILVCPSATQTHAEPLGQRRHEILHRAVDALVGEVRLL